MNNHHLKRLSFLLVFFKVASQIIALLEPGFYVAKFFW